MTGETMKPLSWREWMLCLWVVPVALVGAIFSHFKENWENRNLPLKETREEHPPRLRTKHSRV
jgi:hypothetical protein